VPGPLAGLRVLDFGRFIAAPYCAMLLADFGADVIRIERREGGEDRGLGPVTAAGDGALYLNLNRNKRGITLDPGHAGAGEIVRRLVAGADVVIVNLPVDVLAKLRLDYESLRAIKPDVIQVVATAFGPDGPYRDRVGFDGVLQAMSGAMHLSGLPDQPIRSVVAWADYGTALHAAFGVMAALRHRDQTGQGQLIDVSLLSTSAMFMTPLLMERAATDIVRRPQGNAAFWSSPSDAFRVKDGWIMLPTVGGPMFRRWTRLVGRDELLSDPRFADDISRGNNFRAINDIMIAWCAGRTKAEALAELERARIPSGPVQDLDEFLSDPQVRARQLFAPTEVAGNPAEVPLTRPAVRLSATPGDIHRRAPQLGEHTDEVLGELGFTPDEIANFRRDAVV
jgi:crotonobetainyl-CoA:carnitine CoA-transferase CaiB-like acyl-CoA transferase